MEQSMHGLDTEVPNIILIYAYYTNANVYRCPDGDLL